MNEMMIHNQKIAYTVFGNGKPLICIHGLNLSKDIFLTNYMKNKFSEYKIIAFDLPGYGESEVSNELILDYIHDIVLSFLDNFEITTFSLCGYCMGSVFAILSALQLSNRIESLFLIETMIKYPRWIDFCKTKLFADAYSFIYRHNNFAKIVSYMPVLQEFGKRSRGLFCDSKWNYSINSKYLEMLEKLNIQIYEKELDQLSCRCFLWHSENSFRLVKWSHQFLKKKLPDVETIISYDKGHLIFLD